jgi:uncharacterized protein (TIGR00369 family)
MRSCLILKRKLTTTRAIAGLPEHDFRLLCESLSPYIGDIMKLKVTELEIGKLTMHWPYRKEFIGNPIVPCLHGGVTASIIDHVGGFCAWSSLIDPNKLVNTIDLRIDYLRPAPLEDIICEASVVDVSDGGRLIRSDIICWNATKKIKIAKGRGLYNIYNAKIDVAESIKTRRVVPL